MSTSRRLLKEKNIARRCLEKAVEQEIDDFVQNRNRDCIDDEIAERILIDSMYGDFEDDLFDALYRDDYAQDYYSYEDERLQREYDDDYYNQYLDWEEDLEDDYWDREATKIYSTEYNRWTVGTYYKDHANRTYLCCMVNYMKVMVNVHTGLPINSKENLTLERVG